MDLKTLQKAKLLESQYEALKRDKRNWADNFYKTSTRKRDHAFLFPGDVPAEILERFRLAVIEDINTKITAIIKEFTRL